MHPSSTGRLLGFWLLVIQPFGVLPSKSSSQPSAFSCCVNSLSTAGAGPAREAAISSAVVQRLSAHRLFVGGVPEHRLALAVRLDRQLDRHHRRAAEFGVAVQHARAPDHVEEVTHLVAAWRARDARLLLAVVPCLELLLEITVVTQ